jgi:hypothetical protein
MDEYTNINTLVSIIPDINYGIGLSHSAITPFDGLENKETYIKDVTSLSGAYNYWQYKETDPKLKLYGEELKKANMIGFYYWLMYTYPVYEALNYLAIRDFDKGINEPYVPYDANKKPIYDCVWTKESKHFPSLVEWAKKLPFKTLGPIVLLLKNPGYKTIEHRDCFLQEEPYEHNEQFIWFDPTEKRKLYVKNEYEKQIEMSPGKSFYWNNHDWHGGAQDTKDLSWAIRVEGIFTKELNDTLIFKYKN